MADELIGRQVLVQGDTGDVYGTVTAREPETGNWYGSYTVLLFDGSEITAHTSRLLVLDSGVAPPDAPTRKEAVGAVTAVLYGTTGWSETGARVIAELADTHDWLRLAAVAPEEVTDAAQQ